MEEIFDAEEEISLDASVPEEINSEDKIAALSDENRLLKLKLTCYELGVKKNFIDDTLKLSENSDISSVLQKHPEFIAESALADTGVLAVREKITSDNALRKAFGLK